MEGAQFFRYRTGNSFLHKLHPSLKIVLMLALAISAFYVPMISAFVLWCVLILSSVLFLRFSLREVISDLRPAIFYGFFLYISCVILNTADFFQAFSTENGGFWAVTLDEAFGLLLRLLVPSEYYTGLFIHLALSLEITAVFYRTTSPLQFKTGFETIEHFITRKDDCPVSAQLSLTINFIPRIAGFWSQLNRAWIGRSGKKSIRKITTLLPALFSLSMKEGYRKAMAIEMRR